MIAYYLPQFYPIAFNDRYWGKGYTEWTATAAAKPLFKGHYQPHIPADLGFYNLLMPEVRYAQAEMARNYGIDGFCYWHYWFGNGETIMEKPFQAVLESGAPNFPFCLAWANHDWHNPKTREIILRQTYPGIDDHIAHFHSLLPAFKDSRYITISGKPVFLLFAPLYVPNLNGFIELWNRLAIENGLPGIFFIGSSQSDETTAKYSQFILNAIATIHLEDFLSHRSVWRNRWNTLSRCHTLKSASFSEASRFFITDTESREDVIPTIITGWDHSPRSGRKALILTDYTPESFASHADRALACVSRKKNQLCLIKSWNEWAEGNYLEPDLQYRTAFLEVVRTVKNKYVTSGLYNYSAL